MPGLGTAGSVGIDLALAARDAGAFGGDYDDPDPDFAPRPPPPSSIGQSDNKSGDNIAQTTIDQSNPAQGNSWADIAKKEPSISNPVPVAIVPSAVERGGVIPTASAIDNMTERAAVDTGSNSGQTIINNITNNTTNPTSTPILTAPISPRNRNLGPMWQSQY
jgi:hypothetical protein